MPGGEPEKWGTEQTCGEPIPNWQSMCQSAMSCGGRLVVEQDRQKLQEKYEKGKSSTPATGEGCVRWTRKDRCRGGGVYNKQ